MDDISEGISAFKAMVDSLRGLLTLSREIKDAAPEGPKKEALAQALNELSVNSERFKIELAKEWGYPLCHCEFPPTIMLRKAFDTDWQTYVCETCGNTEYFRARARERR